MAFETILTAEQIETYTRQGYWGDRTITDFLDAAARRTPDKVAFVDARGRITYAELRREVDRCALGLHELGVEPGDVSHSSCPTGSSGSSCTSRRRGSGRSATRSSRSTASARSASWWAWGVSKHCWPERLEVMPELPRTPSGKIRKFELRDQVRGR